MEAIALCLEFNAAGTGEGVEVEEITWERIRRRNGIWRGIPVDLAATVGIVEGCRGVGLFISVGVPKRGTVCVNVGLDVASSNASRLKERRQPTTGQWLRFAKDNVIYGNQVVARVAGFVDTQGSARCYR